MTRGRVTAYLDVDSAGLRATTTEGHVVNSPHAGSAAHQPVDFTIDVTRQDGCGVVTVAGEVDVHTSSRLRDVLFDPSLSSGPMVVVDLRGVTFIDSTGIGTLVAARRWASSRSSTLVLACTAGPVLRVLELVSLNRVFEIHDSVDAALAAPVRPVDAPTDDDQPVDRPVTDRPSRSPGR